MNRCRKEYFLPLWSTTLPSLRRLMCPELITRCDKLQFYIACCSTSTPCLDGVQSIVSEAARLPTSEGEQERFLDPRSMTSFEFDHLSLVRSIECSAFRS